MDPNVRIEEDDELARLGRQETPEGWCPLCRFPMAQHTVIEERQQIGRVRSSTARPIGWRCPESAPRTSTSTSAEEGR